MGVSKPYELVSTIKTLWNSHPKNQGRTYGGGTRDLRAAKDWLEVNDFDGDITELSERFNRFMDSDFDGWRDQDYPIHGFLTHYSRYAAPRKAEKVIGRSTYHCPKCDTDHPVSAKCPPQRDALKLVSNLSSSKRVKP